MIFFLYHTCLICGQESSVMKLIAPDSPHERLECTCGRVWSWYELAEVVAAEVPQ